MKWGPREVVNNSNNNKKQQKSLSTISTFGDTENLTGEDAEYAALAWPALSRRSE